MHVCTSRPSVRPPGLVQAHGTSDSTYGSRGSHACVSRTTRRALHDTFTLLFMIQGHVWVADGVGATKIAWSPAVGYQRCGRPCGIRGPVRSDRRIHGSQGFSARLNDREFRDAYDGQLSKHPFCGPTSIRSAKRALHHRSSGGLFTIKSPTATTRDLSWALRDLPGTMHWCAVLMPLPRRSLDLIHQHLV